MWLAERSDRFHDEKEEKQLKEKQTKQQQRPSRSGAGASRGIPGRADGPVATRDSQTGAVICRVRLKVISAPRSSAASDLSPRPSAKRPTGRNQPKLPLLIRRDR